MSKAGPFAMMALVSPACLSMSCSRFDRPGKTAVLIAAAASAELISARTRFAEVASATTSGKGMGVMAGVGEAVALVVAAAVGAPVSAAGRAVFTSANANKTKQSLSFMLEPTYRSFREAPAQPRMDANGSSLAPPPYHDATKEKQLPQARIELTGSRRADTKFKPRMDTNEHE